MTVPTDHQSRLTAAERQKLLAERKDRLAEVIRRIPGHGPGGSLYGEDTARDIARGLLNLKKKDAADFAALLNGTGPPLGEAREPEVEDDVVPLFDLDAVRFGRFLTSTPPARKWITRDNLPADIVALLGSAGGAGKSSFIYQLGCSVVTGLPFVGMEMGEPGSFLYLAAEDPEDELHRRGLTLLEHVETLAALHGTMGPQEIRDLLDERLFVVSRVSESNLLTSTNSDGEVRETALVSRLIMAAKMIPDLRLIVVDPVSRSRGGRANAEEDTTRFVETLERIRHETGAGVIGLAHINQVGVKDGGGQEIIRGSTALVDGVRWVGTLQRMRRDRAKDFGVEKDDAGRYLQFDVPKSNYAPPFTPIWLRREDGGVLVPVELEEVTVTRQNDKYMAVLGGLQELLDREGPMTENHIATTYAGVLGPLGVGEKAVRDVCKSAVLRKDLVEGTNLGRGGGKVLDVPREDP